MRILQLTDLHLFGEPKDCLLKINTFDTLQEVIKDIKNKAISQGEGADLLPDLVVVSGDISQDYSASSYEFAENAVAQFKCPIFVIPGNHDDPNLFKSILGSSKRVSTDKVINLNNWRIISLNTQIPGRIAGFLFPDEIHFLEKELKANQSIPTVIFMHHHVLPISCDWLNRINLLNGRIFLEKIEQYENVKLVVCGHVHQEVEAWYKNIHFFSTPSTCFQFAKNSKKFKLDTLMPGYRWLELGADGVYTTEVIRIEHNAKFVPDARNRKGY